MTGRRVEPRPSRFRVWWEGLSEEDRGWFRSLGMQFVFAVTIVACLYVTLVWSNPRVVRVDVPKPGPTVTVTATPVPAPVTTMPTPKPTARK